MSYQLELPGFELKPKDIAGNDYYNTLRYGQWRGSSLGNIAHFYQDHTPGIVAISLCKHRQHSKTLTAPKGKIACKECDDLLRRLIILGFRP